MIANMIINKIANESNNILDLGCRNGILRYTEASQGITGIDIIENKTSYDYYYKYNLNKGLPKQVMKHRYDFVLMKDILEHLDNPFSLLKKVRKILVKDGIIVVKVPDYRSKNAWGDYTHIRPYNKGAIVQMVEDAGFKAERVVKLGGYFLPNLITQAFSWLVVARK